MNQSRFILASGSERRVSLLREAGYAFEIQPANLDEEAMGAGLGPAELAEFLAVAKARTVAERFPDAIVLGADTVVALEDQLLGKPTDAEHAKWMLGQLSGSTHRAITGVAVVRNNPMLQIRQHVISTVRMKLLTDQQIETYVGSNQWQGKAGGYGLQDADPFVECIEGCPMNVVGLPMTTTRAMLGRAGVFPRG